MILRFSWRNKSCFAEWIGVQISGKGLQMNMPQRRRIFRIPDPQKYTNSYYPALFWLLSVWRSLCLAQLITVNDQLSAAALFLSPL